MTRNEPLCIATYSSEIEAEMAKINLEQNDIGSFILKDDCGGMQPYLQTFIGVRLMVRTADAESAAKFLVQVRESNGE